MKQEPRPSGSAPSRTPPKGPILSIQYLRAFAAIIVVGAHSNASMMLGQAGVDIFFVISGFIMWTTTSKPQSILTFARNRIIRIVPLYWLATAIMSIHLHAGYDAVLKSMLFIPYIGESSEVWPVLVQGWTLNYEMFFYVLVALAIPLPKRARLAAIVGAVILLVCAGRIVPATGPVLLTYTSPLLIEFCFGIGLAELRFRGRLPNRYAAAFATVVGVAMAWLFASDALPRLDRFLVWGVPSTLLVATALSFEAAGAIRRVGLLLVLGDASYAIYLFHTFLLKTVIRLVDQPSFAIDTVAVMVVAAAAGVAVTLVVEAPLLNYMRERGRVAAPAK